MLEALRQNSKNAVIYLLFGVIIVVFVVNFGPGSGGCESTGGDKKFAARVAGQTLSDVDFRYAYIAQGFTQYPAAFARQQRLKERVMDKLIERELLAAEAERLGFLVSEKEVEDMFFEGRMFVLGIPRNADEFKKDGVFEYDRFQAVCQNRLGVTPAHFTAIQRRELLADKVRQLMLAAIRVSPDEVKEAYDLQGLQVNLEFARFSPRSFDGEVEPQPAEVAEYRKAHEAEIQKHYEDRPYLYKKIEKNAHLRRIVVKVGKEAPEAEVATARAKIDDAARRIQGGEAFAQVAKAVSEDAATKLRGGDLGWRAKGFSGLATTTDDKAFEAKPGALIGPERFDGGFELVTVEGFRSGDLKLEEVALEIAEEKLRAEQGKRKASEAATAAFARLTAGAKFDELFKKPADGAEPASGPTAQETGLFARQGERVPDIGVSSELVKLAFAAKEGDLLAPIEVAGSTVLARVKERKEPDREFFDKHKQDEIRKAERQKWAEVIDSWSKQRCLAARDEGTIKVNPEALAYEGLSSAKDPDAKYEPCGGPPKGLGMLGGP